MRIDLPCRVAQLLFMLGENGVDCHLVGGAARDLILGQEPRDFDFAFSGPPELLVQNLPGLRKAGKTTSVWLKGNWEFSALHADGLEADLLHRDFTMNALAVDKNGTVHAHPQALADLKAGVLRAASSKAFIEDPVRVWRGARMAADYPEFLLDSATLDLMQQAPNCAKAPPERPGRELLRAMAGAKPSRFLAVLHQCGQLGPWLAEMANAHQPPAGPPVYHSGSVLEHTMEVMDKAANLCRSNNIENQQSITVWMALCHDVGKCSTPQHILPHHYGHEKTGETVAGAMGRRLLLPGVFIKAGEVAARLHMKGGQYGVLRPATRRDLIMAVHKAGLFLPFWNLVAADSRHFWLETAQEDLAKVLSVKLPSAWKERGPKSATHLREMQCWALQQAIEEKNTLLP